MTATPTTLQRRPYWQMHLDALLYNNLHTPFAWGVFDCCLFAADAVHAVTGVDLAERWRGYRGARQGMRVLQNAGGVGAIAARSLGFAQRLDSARRGDLVLVPADKRGREALAVVVSSSTAAMPGALGLVQVPLSAALALWAVG